MKSQNYSVFWAVELQATADTRIGVSLINYRTQGKRSRQDGAGRMSLEG